MRPATRWVGVVVVMGLLAVGSGCASPQTHRSLVSGIGHLLAAPFELPVNVLNGAVRGPPLLGLVQGALVGTARTLAHLWVGTTRLAVGAAPYAKYLVFFL